MKLTSWLPYVTSWILVPLASNRKPRRGRRNGHTRLAGELLETRTLLAAVTWDGGGADLNWSDDVLPGSADDVLPGSADDVTIDFGANDFTVVHSFGNTSINSLTSHNGLRAPMWACPHRALITTRQTHQRKLHHCPA